MDFTASAKLPYLAGIPTTGVMLVHTPPEETETRCIFTLEARSLEIYPPKSDTTGTTAEGIGRTIH